MEIKFNKKTHRYKIDGKAAINVSTIKGMLPTSAPLIRYHVLQGIDEWTNKSNLREAARVGSLIHKYLETGKRGWKGTDPAANRLEALACSADVWIEEQKGEPWEHEIVVGCTSPLFAGTADIYNPRTCELGDFKTGGGPWPDRWVQMGGYAKGLIVAGRAVKSFRLVVFREYDIPLQYVAGEDEVKAAIHQFERCYSTYRWLQEAEKKWLRKPSTKQPNS
jgi:hypothetical protein